MAPTFAARPAPGVSGKRASKTDRLGGAIDTTTSSKPKIICKRCKRAFPPERLAQKYCSARCKNAAAVARLRARSDYTKPRRRHLVGVRPEGLTFGQKKPIKTGAKIDPLSVNFRRPVTDFRGIGPDLLNLAIAVETLNYPPLRRLPQRLENGLLNGIFSNEAERERYQRELAESQPPEIEIDADGHPILPAVLDRRR